MPAQLSLPRALAAVLAIAASSLAFRNAGSELVVSRSVDRPDVILSLASHEWERLPVAARFAQRWPRSTVLLTQPDRTDQHACFDCAGRMARLVRAGISADRIVVLRPTVSNTYDEALAALAYATRHRVNRLLIVTSPYHTRRVLLVFRQVSRGLRIEIGIAPAFPDSPAQPPSWWRNRYDRSYVVYEWAALFSYAVRFRLALMPEF